jgi:hypothetical protein
LLLRFSVGDPLLKCSQLLIGQFIQLSIREISIDLECLNRPTPSWLKIASAAFSRTDSNFAPRMRLDKMPVRPIVA